MRMGTGLVILPPGAADPFSVTKKADRLQSSLTLLAENPEFNIRDCYCFSKKLLRLLASEPTTSTWL
jgi:hypothetical protein